MVFRLRSSAFRDSSGIPDKYTGEGEDISPPLAWEDPPAGTQEFALVVDDPDAPQERPWVHWVLYGIAPNLRALSEGDDGGAFEGPNDSGGSGWSGPFPPAGHGTHHYHFKLYALSEQLGLEQGATKEKLLAAMEGRILAQAELIGTYERGAEAHAKR